MPDDFLHFQSWKMFSVTFLLTFLLLCLNLALVGAVPGTLILINTANIYCVCFFNSVGRASEQRTIRVVVVVVVIVVFCFVVVVIVVGTFSGILIFGRLFH